MIEINRDKTYVYDGKEVVFTGRIAKKTLKSNKKKIIYEIRPSDLPEGSDTIHNHWVSESDLFEIGDIE